MFHRLFFKIIKSPKLITAYDSLSNLEILSLNDNKISGIDKDRLKFEVEANLTVLLNNNNLTTRAFTGFIESNPNIKI